MTTRDVLRWNLSARDMTDIATMALAGAVLVLLEAASSRIEAWLDRRAGIQSG